MMDVATKTHRTDEANKVVDSFVLIIYDISDNKTRNNLVRYLSEYGYRVQKSAFEATISDSKYQKMISRFPNYITEDGDSIRTYRLFGRGQVMVWGHDSFSPQEDVIVI